MISDARARGCQFALVLAGDAARLKAATLDELRVAAMFLARALAPFDDGQRGVTPLQATLLRELDAAGRAIGDEMRHRNAEQTA